MPHLKPPFSLPAERHVARLLAVLAIAALVAEPAFATGAGTNGALTSVFDQINGITPGIKAIVAIVGFIVALISLVALRSFSAVLFFLGMAVFGAGGLAVAQALLGSTVSLI